MGGKTLFLRLKKTVVAGRFKGYNFGNSGVLACRQTGRRVELIVMDDARPSEQRHDEGRE